MALEAHCMCIIYTFHRHKSCMCIETNTFCSFVLHVAIVLFIEDNIQNHHRDDLQEMHVYTYIQRSEVLSISDKLNMHLQIKILKGMKHVYHGIVHIRDSCRLHIHVSPCTAVIFAITIYNITHNHCTCVLQCNAHTINHLLFIKQ